MRVVSERSVIFDDKSGEEEISLFDWAKGYLEANPVGYGDVIDTFDVMREKGITEDAVKHDGRLFLQYFDLAKKLGDEFVAHLRMFGYPADKTRKAKKWGYGHLNHVNGNIVYANYPHHVFYRTDSAVKRAVNAMNASYDVGVATDYWEANSPEQFEVWQEFKKQKADFGNVMVEWYFDEAFRTSKKLHAMIEDDIPKIVKTFQGVLSPRYGMYHEDQ